MIWEIIAGIWAFSVAVMLALAWRKRRRKALTEKLYIINEYRDISDEVEPWVRR